MFILKKGHQPGVYVPLRALFLVNILYLMYLNKLTIASGVPIIVTPPTFHYRSRRYLVCCFNSHIQFSVHTAKVTK